MSQFPGSKHKADDKRIGLDTIRVTPDEATELCAHHLQMAAMFFEATPQHFPSVKAEVLRLMAERVAFNYASPAQVGATAFLDAINRHYDGLEGES